MAQIIINEYNDINEFSDTLINLRERINKWFYGISWQQFEGIESIARDERFNWSDELCQKTKRQTILQAIPISGNWFWHKECEYFIDIIHPLHLLEEVYDEGLYSMVVEQTNLLSTGNVVDSLRSHIEKPAIVSELCGHVTNSIVYIQRGGSTIKLKAVLCSTIDSLIRRGSFYALSVLIEKPEIKEIIVSDMRCHIKYKYWLIGLENCVRNNKQIDIEKSQQVLAPLLLTGEYTRFENINTLIQELIGDHFMLQRQLQHLYKFHELVL